MNVILLKLKYFLVPLKNTVGLNATVKFKQSFISIYFTLLVECCHDGEGMVAEAWGSWSHCVQSTGTTGQARIGAGYETWPAQ